MYSSKESGTYLNLPLKICIGLLEGMLALCDLFNREHTVYAKVKEKDYREYMEFSTLLKMYF